MNFEGQLKNPAYNALKFFSSSSNRQHLLSTRLILVYVLEKPFLPSFLSGIHLINPSKFSLSSTSPKKPHLYLALPLTVFSQCHFKTCNSSPMHLRVLHFKLFTEMSASSPGPECEHPETGVVHPPGPAKCQVQGCGVSVWGTVLNWIEFKSLKCMKSKMTKVQRTAFYSFNYSFLEFYFCGISSFEEEGPSMCYSSSRLQEKCRDKNGGD